MVHGDADGLGVLGREARLLQLLHREALPQPRLVVVLLVLMVLVCGVWGLVVSRRVVDWVDRS